MRVIFFVFLNCLIFLSCQKDINKVRKKRIKSEYIYRRSDTLFFPIFKPKIRKRKLYPWEKDKVENLFKITKEFFRCRGKNSNPVIYDNVFKREYGDCNGYLEHGLPIINGKENVYEVLIDLLNYIQYKTKKKVVITSGYRCPKHNLYSDRSRRNRVSKHMIGAEVDFYVIGFERNPSFIIDLIFQFYKEKDFYKNKSEYQNFQRYLKNTDVSINPWYNKEIFIKLYQEKEGRDFDNRHSYPYISVQVRFDKNKKELVSYSYGKAYRGFLRW